MAFTNWTSRQDPTVITVLTNPNTRPGYDIEGSVRVWGGKDSSIIDRLSLSLTVSASDAVAAELQALELLSDPLHLGAGDRRLIPFRMPVPWDAPITAVSGERLHPVSLCLRTEWRPDFPPLLSRLTVHPSIVQERVLAAMEHLGYRLTASKVDGGGVLGPAGRAPLAQRFTFQAEPRRAVVSRRVGVTFVSNPVATDILIEVDTGPPARHLRLDHADVGWQSPWVDLDGWLRWAIDTRGDEPAWPVADHVPPHGWSSAVKPISRASSAS